MKRILSLTLIISLLCFGNYLFFEPEIIKAANDAVVVTLTVSPEISVSDAAAITMDSAITMTQATSTGGGNSPWTVKTNDTDGWTFTVAASQNPALQSATRKIDNWQPSTSTSWHATNTAAFGFAVFGDDVRTDSWGTDTNCTSTESGKPSTTLFWRGFNSTNAVTVVTSNATTSAAGSNIYLCAVAEQNQYYIADGTYTATITGTATQQ